MRRSVIVVGGGIAGLVAARELASGHDVVLLEQSDRLGGKISSGELRGRPLDLGPDAFITRNPAGQRQLCEELGLLGELVAPASASAAIFSRGALHRFPSGLVFGIPTDLRALRRSNVVGLASVVRAIGDLISPRHCAPPGLARLAASGEVDPTISELVGGRLGAAIVAALVDPLLGGINAGDTGTLSFAAAVPSLAASIGGRRSLIRALRPPNETSSRAATGQPPLFLGLRGGLERLIDRLADECRQLGAELRTARRAVRVEHDRGEMSRFSVRVDGEVLTADGLVLATPAFATVALLEPLNAGLAEQCRQIPYAGVVLVTLVWPASAVPTALGRALATGLSAAPGGADPLRSPPDASGALPGSGVLVGRGEGRLITAMTFTSTKWPGSARPGEIVVRASAGRHGDERALQLSDDQLVDAVRRDLGVILGLDEVPVAQLVQRWPTSFPQYVTGHLARVARIDALAAEIPGLALAGAAYHGIGIPACVEDARRAARQVATALAR